MAKQADRYFRTDPWKIIEEGFDPRYARVAESVFSLANETMGVRGYFDEGGSVDSLRGADKQTVMVRLFVFSTEQTVNADAMMRSVVFAMIPPIILFFIFQKQLTENAVSVGIKG